MFAGDNHHDWIVYNIILILIKLPLQGNYIEIKKFLTRRASAV